MYYLTVLNEIFLTFQTQLSFGFGFRHAAQFYQFIHGNYLRADEAFLQIGVDSPGGIVGRSQQ